ncbi:hypothetical protein AC249_AIPGENE24214, partial [Exaiptasia diaphana]
MPEEHRAKRQAQPQASRLPRASSSSELYRSSAAIFPTTKTEPPAQEIRRSRDSGRRIPPSTDKKWKGSTFEKTPLAAIRSTNAGRLSALKRRAEKRPPPDKSAPPPP